MNKLAQRIVTAAVLLCILLGVFFLLPSAAALAVLAGFVAVAAWEWSAFIPCQTRIGRSAFTLLVLILMALVTGILGRAVSPVVLWWLALLWWALAFVLILRYPVHFGRVFGTLAGLLVILPPWAALVVLFGLPERGIEYLLFVLLIVWAADIGAYFTGRALGRTKLAPQVSPGKTWEGFIGGLLASLGVAWAGSDWFGWSLGFVLPAALGVASVSVVGDLTVSMFKRNAKLKDSGTLFPGHGGVLDRIDSVTAALPLFALQLAWIELIPA